MNHPPQNALFQAHSAPEIVTFYALFQQAKLLCVAQEKELPTSSNTWRFQRRIMIQDVEKLVLMPPILDKLDSC